MGKWLILAGCVLVVTGLVLHFFPGVFNWFGRLPGDLKFESDRTKVFIPITSMIIISVVLTVIMNLFRH